MPLPGGRGILQPMTKLAFAPSLCGLLLLGSLGVAQAQTGIPALPPAPQPVPVPAPAPVPSPTPAPAPVTAPAPASPAPQQPQTPAPQLPKDQSPKEQPQKVQTPKPPVSSRLSPAPTPSPLRAPLLIQARVNVPALVAGKKTTVPQLRTLTIPGERAAQLRQRGEVTVSLQADLDTFLKSLAAPRDARFEQQGDGQWAAVQHNGLKVDAQATRAAVQKALRDPRGVSADVVVTGQVAPQRTLDFFASRGITTFLATGFTSYYGSSPERVKNIHVGARNFKDRLFEGDVFSFNQFVGPISQRNGYVPGLVIAGDQTASGVGGGICQVSTTVFRTLYGAGLKVVQRQNHSYQVFYYDPQGLDATIYQPQLDLKFGNDTGGAIWFQTEWDDQEATLSITAFGQARDYRVEVGTPKTLKTVAPPKDRVIYDASLPAGQRKQVDWAAPGATIEVTRRFVRGGKTFKQDTLRSVYRPWPNIFRVGTKK